jgi:hypothetical protein
MTEMKEHERCYATWAPEGSPWSAWAKPVLFSEMARLTPRAAPLEAFGGGLPRFGADVAVVVDLVGHQSVRAGLALARRGWRPVPLFNATTAPKAVIDVVSTIERLHAGAADLAGIPLDAGAPPAFLLDARRMSGRAAPGTYDNSSIALPQDFPSATMLRSRGIKAVVVLQEREGAPARDLCHVLLRWQQGGLNLYTHLVHGGETAPLVVAPPSLFRKAWYRMVALLGLRRSNVGGFGALVPEASSGGYG